MALPEFKDLDDPRPKKKTAPIVLVGPRGQMHELPGSEADARTTLGGDCIGTWHDGTFTIPKRHRECSFEIGEDGEAYVIGWIEYEDLCRDPSVIERHKLTRQESVAYYERHRKLLEMRDRGNNVSEAITDWSAWYHPEVVRRRGIPVDSGRNVTPEQLAAELGVPAAKAKAATAADLMGEAAKASRRG